MKRGPLGSLGFARRHGDMRCAGSRAGRLTTARMRSPGESVPTSESETVLERVRRCVSLSWSSKSRCWSWRDANAARISLVGIRRLPVIGPDRDKVAARGGAADAVYQFETLDVAALARSSRAWTRHVRATAANVVEQNQHTRRPHVACEPASLIACDAAATRGPVAGLGRASPAGASPYRVASRCFRSLRASGDGCCRGEARAKEAVVATYNTAGTI